MENTTSLFRNLTADDPNPEITEIESLCINCQDNGITRCLLTKIPFYKEIVIMSFSCEHCGYENNDLQSGGEIAEKGIRLILKVNAIADLNRQVIKSDFTSIRIVELDFEIPTKSQKGEVTTVEGLIDRSVRGLEQDQSKRKLENPDVANQIEEFVKKLKDFKKVESSFTLILEDISGNSFIENPRAPQADHQCTVQHFKRTRDQDHELGIFVREEIVCDEATSSNGLLRPICEDEFTLEDLHGEIMQFPTNCTNCGAHCETNMKVTNIPHFKEVIIMSTNCEACGHRTNEIKSGGGIESKGVKIDVSIVDKDDLCRDLLKSETCQLNIPELDLEVGPRALSGRFTTVEGLLLAMQHQLNNNIFKDSQDTESKKRFDEFIGKFDEIFKNELQITLVLDDPAGNSYVKSLNDNEDLPDEKLKILYYDRSFEQNEELGLNDIKTENYES